MQSSIRSRSEWRLGAVVLAVLLGLSGLPAVAEVSGEAKAQAREKFTQGNEAYERGAYREALAAYLVFDLHLRVGYVHKALHLYNTLLLPALEQAPLLRIVLVHWDLERWQFVLVHHHLLMDGWCRAQLFEELFACYRARLAGQTAQLAPALPYRLFIDWLQAQDLAETESYWRRTLADFRVPTPLHGDLSASDPGEVLEYRFELDADSSAALGAELRRRRLTLSTLVSGAWALWLAAQAQSDDVVFGATIAGRPATLPEAEQIVGLFINTLAVRARIERSSSFGAWLEALQVAQAESREYEQTPLRWCRPGPTRRARRACLKVWW